jgi:hypothetical protein
VGEVNGRVFLNNVSLGVYGDAVRQPTYRDAKARTAAAAPQRRSRKPSSGATEPECPARFFGGWFVPEHEDVDECRKRRGERHGEDDGESAEQQAHYRDVQERLPSM